MINELSNFIDQVKNIYPTFSNLIVSSTPYLPFISESWQNIKISRLKLRLKNNEELILKISDLSKSSILSSQYIEEKIFPIVLVDLINEHEDAKINLILTGFLNVFIDEKSEESIVLNYFDTLRQLRYADIKRLFYLADIYIDYVLPQPNSEEQALKDSIDLKLQRLGLISYQRYGAILGKFSSHERITKENVIIDLYGKKFIKFITTNLK